jgi:hypothetical protein
MRLVPFNYLTHFKYSIIFTFLTLHWYQNAPASVTLTPPHGIKTTPLQRDFSRLHLARYLNHGFGKPRHFCHYKGYIMLSADLALFFTFLLIGFTVFILLVIKEYISILFSDYITNVKRQINIKNK